MSEAIHDVPRTGTPSTRHDDRPVCLRLLDALILCWYLCSTIMLVSSAEIC